MKDIKEILEGIHSVNDIKTGRLPGYFFEKLIEIGQLIINPFDDKAVGNVCYYLHLGTCFRVQRAGGAIIDPFSKESIEAAFEPYVELRSFVLEPGKSVIAQSQELLGVSTWFELKLENTTELGRIFLNHASHGFIHPGHGIEDPFQLMVELTNLGNIPVQLTPGLPIFRMYIEKLAYEALGFYSDKTVTTPKLRMDEKDRS